MPEQWRPEIGRQYRLKVRGEDAPCPGCGAVHSASLLKRHMDGKVITVRENPRWVICGNCPRVIDAQGYVTTDLPSNDGGELAVPVTWLAPLDAEVKQWRVF